MNFFISYAEASENLSQNNPYSFVIMLIIFCLIFYLIILRPQQKRVKEHKKLMSSISKNDEVQTTSGIIGKITKVHQNGYLTMLINESTEIIIKKDFIANILPKGTMKSL